jgi:hypothetical protein
MLFSTVVKSFKSARRFDIEVIYSCFQIDIECFVFKSRGVRGVVSVDKGVVSIEVAVLSLLLEVILSVN